MASGLLSWSFPRASSITTGGSCRRSKKGANNYYAKSHEAEPLAPISKSISESIKDVMDVFCKFSRPYITIALVLGILSTSLLAVENLSDLSPRFFIGLFQYTTASICMVVYHCGLNELADVEIDKSLGIGWLVGSRPMLWGLLASFALGTAYSINLPLLRWKRFTSLTWVYAVVNPLICFHLASFHHMKTYVLKRAAVYPRSMILILLMTGIYFTAIALAKDIPDMEGDKAGGIQTLAIRLGPERVLWFCVSLLEMANGVAILVGATSSFLWRKIVMVLAHTIMALVLWYNAKSVDLESKASSQSFFMIIVKLLWAEYIVIAFAR